MSEWEQLAARLVEAVAQNMLRRYESEYQADHLNWHDFDRDASEDVATLLRELAGLHEQREPDDGMSPFEMRSLADFIEKGTTDG